MIIVLISLIALASGVFVPPRPGTKRHHLLGEKECTYGPSYWCQNLTNAADCHTTKHCIETVWIHKQLPEDHNSICDTCVDMVKQARDQLESNETQELIKEVFEGSCALLRLKPIVKECDKIADNYIPDLIDTLASQMNPQVVCSVAGLCNSPRVHQLLIEAGEQVKDVQPKSDVCADCHTVLDIVVANFNKMHQSEVLEAFLRACGKLGSFSDACAANVIENFQQIYNYLKDNLNTNDICVLSGECFGQFHRHDSVEITPMSKTGYVHVQGDDMPCDLCKQLVQHLRDILIANTTESEFKRVLEGVCKQTGQFAQECQNYVEEYYPEIYNYLVKELKPLEVCDMIGVCHPTDKKSTYLAPLLPVESAPKALKLASVLKETEDKKIETIDPVMYQLPIERVMPPMADVYNRQVCVFCEYFLHYVQNAITDPKTEAEIKEIVDKTCEKLPSSINATCINFLDTYEPALVALLAQEIDPSQICPLIKACPTQELADVDVFMSNPKSSEKCPLCLYAVTEIESMITDKSNKAAIEEAIKKVCTRLPKSLKAECTDFVDKYGNQLIEMLIADFKPQEVCVYLKLCTDATPINEEKAIKEVAMEEKKIYGGDIETNIIMDDTINGYHAYGDSKCVLCEFIMREIDNQLKNKKTDDEIKTVVRDICKVMPGTIKTQCNDYIDQYGDMIIMLLQESLEPAKICAVMKMCTRRDPTSVIRVGILDCAVCEATVVAMEKILSNPHVDHDMEHVLEKTCRGLPRHYRSRCVTLVEDYGKIVIDMVAHTGSKAVCQKIHFCKTDSYEFVGLL